MDLIQLEQLSRLMRMLSRLQALSHDPEAADLVQSGARLAAALEPVMHLLRVTQGLPFEDESDGPPSLGGLLSLSLILPRLLPQDAANRQQPLTERVIRDLPTISCTLGVIHRLRRHNDGEALCAICHEEYVVGKNLMKLPCEHMFCVDCGRQWLRRSNTCPICRTEVKGSCDNDDADAGEERAGSTSGTHGGEEWHSDDLFPFRVPQGSTLSAIRTARNVQQQEQRSLELWPPVEDVGRIAEEHSAWPRTQPDRLPPGESRETPPTASRTTRNEADNDRDSSGILIGRNGAGPRSSHSVRNSPSQGQRSTLTTAGRSPGSTETVSRQRGEPGIMARPRGEPSSALARIRRGASLPSSTSSSTTATAPPRSSDSQGRAGESILNRRFSPSALSTEERSGSRATNRRRHSAA